jgi:hypothetical protein
MAARGGGGFDVPGYVMSADEVSFWQDLAALLDPAAYEFVVGSNTSRTVASGETWYLASAWYLQGPSGAAEFHRHGDIHEALPLTDGTVLTTWTAGTTYGPPTGTANMYLCKPSLVTGGDSRYTDDPRALYFDRMRQIGELTQYTIGNANTGNTPIYTAFPTDFTNGLVVHVSAHDIAWIDLTHVGDDTGLTIHDEISDTNRCRFAMRCIIPFVRTVFPKIGFRGATQAEGNGTIRYLKLPGGW